MASLRSRNLSARHRTACVDPSSVRAEPTTWSFWLIAYGANEPMSLVAPSLYRNASIDPPTDALAEYAMCPSSLRDGQLPNSGGPFDGRSAATPFRATNSPP